MIYKSENAPKESEKGCYHAVSLSGGKDSTAIDEQKRAVRSGFDIQPKLKTAVQYSQMK